MFGTGHVIQTVDEGRVGRFDHLKEVREGRRKKILDQELSEESGPS